MQTRTYGKQRTGAGTTRTRGQKPDWIRFSGVEAGTGAGDKTRSWCGLRADAESGGAGTPALDGRRPVHYGRGAQDTRAVLQEILDRAGVADLRHVLYNYYPGGMCMLNRPRTFGVRLTGATWYENGSYRRAARE